MPGLLPAFTALLLAGAPHCYLVTNHGIVTVPACDFSPAAIAELTKDVQPAEPRGAGEAAAQQPPRETSRWQGYGHQWTGVAPARHP